MNQDNIAATQAEEANKSLTELGNYAELQTDDNVPDANTSSGSSAPPSVDDEPVKTESADWTISSLREKWERGRIELQPDYQREYVWKLKPELPSRLIESLLLDIPVPPVYFAQLPGGVLEVIDGQQRLTTMMSFVKNEFTLQKLLRMSSLNGKKFSDLGDEHQEKILDARVRSVVIDTGTNSDLRYEVFERLNRGSMALNEMELRNCVYRGDFCDLLIVLEKEDVWRRVKDSKTGGEPEPRFTEREIILRFFAFANRVEFYKSNLKRFLNEYMGIHAPKSGQVEQIEEQAETFRKTMKNIWDVFGVHSARLYIPGENSTLPDGRWETKFSVAAFDIQASALLNEDPAKVQAAADQIKEAYLLYLLSNSDVREAISSSQAGRAATRTRWFGFKAIVTGLLNNTQVEPRFFSYDFRKQLFDSDPICKLCNNPIHAFEDCAVDHIQPYSKGGKTEAANAQLAHRSCNARKWANA